MAKRKEIFIIKHNMITRGVSKPPVKLTETELKSITNQLDKVGIAWVYLPPGITHTITHGYEECEEECDDC